MRARMWKPGQSGNPAGVSKAYAEAMREMSMRSRELSLGAERTRRWRRRRQHGLVVVSFDVAPDVTGKLIRFGWLDPNKRGDKEAIARALVELAEKATELEVTPASRSMWPIGAQAVGQHVSVAPVILGAGHGEAARNRSS